MSKLAILAILAIASVCQAKPPKKIVAGQLAQPGEFPFIVSLNVNGVHSCGGSIIGDRWIVTAAHCVIGVTQRPYNNFFIRAGSLSSVDGGQIYRAKNIYYHSQYVSGVPSSPNDIGLIELTTPIRFDQNTKAIPIAASETPGGRPAKAAGWGSFYGHSGQISRDLYKTDMITVDLNVCQAYEKTTIYTHQVCAVGARRSGVCQGDSGGPLVANGQLIGIVSYGEPCALGPPDIFSSAYHYRDWIKGVQDGTLKPTQQNIFGSFFQFPY